MKHRMKILLCHDGSKPANAMVEELTRAGLPEEAEAVVISVAELWLPPPSSGEMFAGSAAPTLDERSKDAMSLSQGVAERLRSNFPGWKVLAEGSVGSPDREILRKAAEWRPELIVLGSHGHSAIERLLLGSVPLKVMHDAACSVRIARGNVRQIDSPVRIIIGFGGLKFSWAAVRIVAARSWPPNTEVRLITSIGPLIHANEIAWEAERSRVREMQQEAETKLSEARLRVSSIIEERDPKRLLVEEARDWQADCIFVGTSSLDALGRLLVGSVSSAVAARAHCSVEVVRALE
jgi:nucleotide-binding universal stress UspA family protein